jgi:Mrp family chromosome partitioning ATPase
LLAEEAEVANLLVTFVGLPGTGKSTLSARAAQLLLQRGIPCRVCKEAAFRKLRNKAAWVAREVIGNPRWAARSVRGILATRQRSLLDLVKMVVNWLCLSFLIRRAAGAGGVCLFDEGLFQALWSVGLGARNEGWLSSLPLLDPTPPAPSLTVVVRSSLETVERRLAARPACASRLEKWLPEDPGILSKAGRLMEVVEELVGRRCRREEGMRVLVIDNDRKDALQANALKITNYVQQLLTDRGGAPPAAGDRTPMGERAVCALPGAAR